LGPLTLGIGLVVIALATLLSLAGAFAFTLAQAAAMLLLVLGIGMAVGGFVGRARWLTLPMLAIVPFALVLTVLHIDLDDGIGERTITIRTLDEPVERRLAAGDMTVDLLNLRPGESGTVNIHVGAGMLTLNIPDDITVELTGSVGLGTTQTLHSRVTRGGVHACCGYAEALGGFAQPIRWGGGPRAGSVAGTVRIQATVGRSGAHQPREQEPIAMKPHRFDPFSFVVGLAIAVLGGMLLWGDLDVPDLRPSRLWPLPVFAVGLMFTLYGVRRLVESMREAALTETEAWAETDPDGSNTLEQD